MKIERRRLLAGAGVAALCLQTRGALADTVEAPCFLRADELTTESVESPFYEHFHQLTIPLEALVEPPAEGLVIRSGPVDQGSYDVEAFEKFIRSSRLDEKALVRHQHDVMIAQDQLRRIASGEKDVEVRVISKNGNDVHNFLITAPPSALVKVKKHRKARAGKK